MSFAAVGGEDEAYTFSVKVNVLPSPAADPLIKGDIDSIEHKRADQEDKQFVSSFVEFVPATSIS